MFRMNSILKTSVLPAAVCLAAASAMAQSTGKPTDPQIADIAYTAGQIDIEQAIDALKRTHTQAVRYFAEEMIRDNMAVNKQVVTLLCLARVVLGGCIGSESTNWRLDPRPAGCM